MKKNVKKTVAAVAAVVVLIIAFVCGGKTPENGAEIADSGFSEQKISETVPENVVRDEYSALEPKKSAEENDSATENKPSETIVDKQKENFPEVTATPEPTPADNIEKGEVSDGVYTCTLSVVCNTALENESRLSSEKIGILPANGVIYAENTVTFYEGETVFNLLVREMKRSKIHLEFEKVPVYNSAYIEGIANLYELDCGGLSGWMYKVNGIFPNYGCSQYVLKEGDRVEWVYTCDLGKDVGGEYSARNGR